MNNVLPVVGYLMSRIKTTFIPVNPTVRLIPKVIQTMSNTTTHSADNALLDKLVFDHTYNSPFEASVQTSGVEKHDPALLRFMGSYSDEGTGGDRAVEIIVRGRHNELDFGSAKSGENGEWKVKTDCSYYKLVIDGREWLEIDFVNKIFMVMGVDRMAAHRRNIGL